LAVGHESLLVHHGGLPSNREPLEFAQINAEADLFAAEVGFEASNAAENSEGCSRRPARGVESFFDGNQAHFPLLEVVHGLKEFSGRAKYGAQ
jgi:hypothetical protein